MTISSHPDRDIEAICISEGELQLAIEGNVLGDIAGLYRICFGFCE